MLFSNDFTLLRMTNEFCGCHWTHCRECICPYVECSQKPPPHRRHHSRLPRHSRPQGDIATSTPQFYMHTYNLCFVILVDDDMHLDPFSGVCLWARDGKFLSQCACCEICLRTATLFHDPPFLGKESTADQQVRFPAHA